MKSIFPERELSIHLIGEQYILSLLMPLIAERKGFLADRLKPQYQIANEQPHEI